MISDWAEPTQEVDALSSNMQRIDPLAPPNELVCRLMLTTIPPGSEIERFAFETRIDWPAKLNPTHSASPLTLACPVLQLALELDFTAVAATSPFNRFTFWSSRW